MSNAMEPRLDFADAADPRPPARLIGVRLREGGRADDYLTEEAGLHVGDHVVVEVPNGQAVGEIRRPARDVPESRRDRTYPRVLRLATADELAEVRRRRDREKTAVTTVQIRAKSHGLAMKIVDVEMTPDGRRLTVLFAAEGRVDFARIEMRQIGARDVTKIQEGIGPCGRELCCSSHLRKFEPISVRMAKAQDMPLTDSRLLGNCGRLKCCLLYEFSMYEELRARLPRVGSACEADCGGGGCMQGRVKGIKVLKESVLVSFADGTEAEVPLAQLTWEGRPHVKPLTE
jgi:cell fate regulator YaaT (PSP1 superfamily)